jgi:hypothetical protein
MMTANMNTTMTLAARRTSSTTTNDAIIVLIVLFIACFIGSIFYYFYVRMVPSSKNVLRNFNPIVLLLVWPSHFLDFMCWVVGKVCGKQSRQPDVKMQQEPHPSGYVSGVGAIHPIHIPPSHLTSTSLDTDTCNGFRPTPPHAFLPSYDFPTYSSYTSGLNVIGGENYSYFAADLCSDQHTQAAIVNAKEVERCRMEVDSIKAERVGQRDLEIKPTNTFPAALFNDSSAPSSTCETPDASKTSIGQLFHGNSVETGAKLCFVGSGRPKLVHAISRPESATGFIEQCRDRLDFEYSEPEESTQAELEAAQVFQYRAHLHEMEEAQSQVDIEAAIADFRKQLFSQVIRESVIDMFEALPVQRLDGWKGASLVIPESLPGIKMDFYDGSSSAFDPGPNGLGPLVQSPDHFTSDFKTESDFMPESESDFDEEVAEDEVATYIKYSSEFHTAKPPTNSASSTTSTVSEDHPIEVSYPFVNDFLSLSSASPVFVNEHSKRETLIELRESITAMFANNPVQHPRGQGGSKVSSRSASISSFETYPDGMSTSNSAFDNPIKDSSEVSSACRFLTKTRISAAEMNELCEPFLAALEENNVENGNVPLVLEAEQRPVNPKTLEVEDSVVARRPSFTIPQVSAKLLKKMVLRWELQQNEGHVPHETFVPDWKFEKDMAR